MSDRRNYNVSNNAICCYYVTECESPLGVADDRIITNDQLSASSQMDDYSAIYGRLNSNKAWKPNRTRSSAAGEWIQVAFPSPIMATAIATQGMPPRSSIQDYVAYYKVQISSDGQSWRYIQNTDNGDTVIIDIFDPLHVVTSFD